MKLKSLGQILRRDFPLLNEHYPNMSYLDNAATTQKPYAVINTIRDFYMHSNANVHRGVYRLSEEATKLYESARQKVANFLGVPSAREIIFTRGTTEAINLIAYTWGWQHLKAGDEILLTVLEHHSNLVPWQIIAEKTGARLRYLPLNKEYRLNIAKLDEYLSPRTKIVTCSYVSHVLGFTNPIKEIIKRAKSYGAITVIDGAQSAPQRLTDIHSLECDFYTFSGHKLLGPTGIGVLWGRYDLLKSMQPFQGGGSMISNVELYKSTWEEPPQRFEAGTPPIAEAIGLVAAIDYLEQFSSQEIKLHKTTLCRYVYDYLETKKGWHFFAPYGDDWSGILTLFHDHYHPHDLVMIADQFDVCLRAGHHCAEPLMKALGVSSTLRISPYLYNTQQDMEHLLIAFDKAEELL